MDDCNCAARHYSDGAALMKHKDAAMRRIFFQEMYRVNS